MEKDFWEKKYEVVFVNGEKAEFLKDGSWEKVDCKYSTVPTGIVPQAIKDYVSKHYPCLLYTSQYRIGYGLPWSEHKYKISLPDPVPTIPCPETF